MNDLLIKYNEYSRLIGYEITYRLSNGDDICFQYRIENFLHLLGLHKLDDIKIIQLWLDKSNRAVKMKDVLRRIKKEKLCHSHIISSIKFPIIRDWYEEFTYSNLVSLMYTDAVINFNPTKIHSSLKSDYILFKELNSNSYNCLGIAYDYNRQFRYVETFFNDKYGNYIKNQTVVQIISMTVKDKDGKVIYYKTFTWHVS